MVMEVLEVIEFESVFKIEVAQFFVCLGTIFADIWALREDGRSYGPGDFPIVFFVEYYIFIGHF